MRAQSIHHLLIILQWFPSPLNKSWTLPLAFKGLYTLCPVLRCHDLSLKHPAFLHFPFPRWGTPSLERASVWCGFHSVTVFDSEVSINPHATAGTAEILHTPLPSFLLRQRYDSLTASTASLPKPLLNPSQPLICSPCP